MLGQNPIDPCVHGRADLRKSIQSGSEFSLREHRVFCYTELLVQGSHHKSQ